MQLGGLENRSLAEQVADRMEQMIIDNKLSSGDKLPNEMDLVAEIGVGRGTIREAIKILESRNVVEIRRGKGTFICDNVGKVGDPLGFRFIADKKKLAQDLSDLRYILEPKIAAISAEKATEEDVQELQRISSDVEKLIEKGENYCKRDMDFHIKIAEMTGNLVISQIIPVITDGITLYVELTNHKYAGTAAITHQRVVDAIRNHDSKGAYEAMADHLKENKENLKLFDGNYIS